VSKFAPATAALLLADCKRRCCICLERRKLHIHHIIAEANDGLGSYENGIPVCLDCHAEVESKSTMGRQYSPEELRLHRDRWFELVRERPEVLLRAGSTQTETGPLEALVAELGFNHVATVAPGLAPLTVKQFERAIATCALLSLTKEVGKPLLLAYADVCALNYALEELRVVDRAGGRQSAYQTVRERVDALRTKLAETLPDVRDRLRDSLSA
jgi:hypothetical protein